MDIKQLKKFIDSNIVDFSELVLDNYYSLGLDETDAIMLIKLHNLLNKNITFIKAKDLSEMLSISTQTTSKRLNSLIDRGFIQMELIKGENGREKESFNLDLIFERILRSDFEERKGENVHKTSEAELVKLFETEFKKPLSVLDIQTITKWLNDDKYSFDDIKEALFKAVKSRRTTIKYVDGILLRSEESMPKVYKKTNLMRDFHKLWEK